MVLEKINIVKTLTSDKLVSFDERKQNAFIRTEEGSIKKLFSNLKVMLLKSEKLKGIQFNEFTQEISVNGNVITDSLMAELKFDLSNEYYMDFSIDDILQMVQIIAREHPVHPIKQIIERKPWDSVERAETLFIDYLGADDNEYVRTVTRKWLAAAVARVYEPGIKFEMVPVLQGAQGIGKSTVVDRIAGEYFVDSLKSLGNSKDDYQMLIGAWIVELGELSSLNDTRIETMKGFISARVDKLRLPYGKITQSFSRTCVFIGTTNPGTYLRDSTGNRRFFPIPLNGKKKEDIFDMTDEEIQQLWAEAYHYYTNGEKLYSDDETEQLAEPYRKDAMEENLLLTQVDEYLSMPVPKNWNTLSDLAKRTYYDKYRFDGLYEDESIIDKTTTAELAYVMGIRATDTHANSKTKLIAVHMESHEDWEKKAVYINGKTQRGYKKKL